MQFKKGIICAVMFTMTSLMSAMLTGCAKDGKMLSDSELADVLSKSLGETVEITEAPEGASDGEYSMKCADGTEFTVKRMRLLRREFGPRYYDYYCDYLVNWVHDHPELNAAADERGIAHENFGRGTMIFAGNFDEVHTAVEAACEIAEDNTNHIPAVSDFSGEYDLRFERPKVNVYALNGTTSSDGMRWLWAEYEYSDGTEKNDYDEELEIFLAEREYVDDVRKGEIEVSLPDKVLEKYGPSKLKTELMNREWDLDRASNNGKGEIITVGKTETLYYIGQFITLNEDDKTLDFSNIALWAECTGFEPYAFDDKSYTLARGDEKVVFSFSDSESYAERDGKRIDLRGVIEKDNKTHMIELTPDDLKKLFDTELKFDYINGTAEITNKKT